MNKTSKRDIYDLIAELAKTSNMDLDGTEFAPVNVDVRRKPSVDDITLVKEPSPIAPTLPERHVEIELNPTLQSVSQIDESSFEQASSMQDLNLLKAAAIEELKRARATMINELRGTMNGQANSILQNNDVAEVHVATSSSNPTQSKISDTETIQPISTTSINESQSDSFEELDIDELNRITAEAVKPKFTETEIQEANLLATKALEEQLKVISDKLDKIGQTNTTSELIQELKLSDERIKQQVSNSNEKLINDLALKLQQIKPVSVDSFIRWIGIVNLMILLVVLIYLLFQKGNAATTSQSIQPTEVQPPVQHDSNTSQTSETSSNHSELTITETNETPVEKSTSDLLNEQPTIPAKISSPKFNHKTNRELVKTNPPAEKSSSNNSEKTTQETVQLTPIAVSKNAAPSRPISTTTATKNTITSTKSSSDNSKKTSSSQDVYFGED